MRFKQLNGVLIAAVALVFALPAAQAVQYTFGNISGNDVTDAAAGESQLFVDVTDAGGGQVLFTFGNVGSEDMSITDVYFEDGALLGIAGLIDADEGVGGDAGVDFSEDADPSNLPSANNAPVTAFVTTQDFSADSDAPAQPNGVNQGETLGILFDLQGDATFDDVIAAINLGLTAPDPGSGDTLRIGIHVQGFDGGGSESFVNVPEPGFYGLISMAMIGFYGLMRRRSNAR